MVLGIEVGSTHCVLAIAMITESSLLESSMSSPWDLASNILFLAFSPAESRPVASGF